MIWMVCEKMLIIPYKSEQPGILFQVFLNQFTILYYRGVGFWGFWFVASHSDSAKGNQIFSTNFYQREHRFLRIIAALRC